MANIVTQNERVEDILIELSLCDKDNLKEQNIALLSDSEEFKKLNYFIFRDVEGINYMTIDTPYDKDLSILSEMDLIIFNKKDEDLENLILKNIHKKHLRSRFIHVVEDKGYRKVDFLNEYLAGVSKILKIDSELEEYIFEIQKELRNNFYSKRLLNINTLPILTKKEDFEFRINELIKNRIFFTKLRFKYDSDMDILEYNIKKTIRKRDTIYVDKNLHELYFVLLDVMPKKAGDIVKERIKNFSIRVNEVSHKNVFDLIFDKVSE